MVRQLEDSQRDVKTCRCRSRFKGQSEGMSGEDGQCVKQSGKRERHTLRQTERYEDTLSRRALFIQSYSRAAEEAQFCLKRSKGRSRFDSFELVSELLSCRPLTLTLAS